MSRRSLLLVEDDPALRSSTGSFLRTRDFDVVAAASCAEAERAYTAARPDVALLDFELPDGTALNLLPRLREAGVPVIVLTGNGTIDRAVRAIKEGAEQFLTKPIERDVLLDVIERTLQNHRSRRKQLASEAGEARHAVDPFIGTSAAIRKLREDAKRVAATDSPVLILGETGSGKGVLARWLHRESDRGDEPFVDLNCAGLPKELLESELFGYERGAFTGADKAKQGLLEIANRGTVFLDELGDADLQVQPRLLKVLEEKRFRRLGDVRDRLVDIRLVAATHHDLAGAVREKKFREDLYFRVNTFPLRVPPLRQRLEDLPRIAAVLLERIEGPRRNLRLSPEALQRLQSYPWPGNVRELRNVLERAAILAATAELQPADLRFEAEASSTSHVAAAAEEMTMEAAERRHIEAMLRRAGNVADAARILAMPKSTLYYKLKKFGIAIPTVGELEGS